MHPKQVVESISSAFENTRKVHADQNGAGHYHMGFCLIRLDELEGITQSVGIETADLLVDEFESRLRSVARSDDDLLVVGQGLFGIIFAGLVNEQHAELAIAKIERLIAEPIELVDSEINVRAHVGMTTTGDIGLQPALFYQRGLAAQRQARSENRSVLMGDDQRDIETAQDWQLIAELKKAFTAGEFVPFFQPKVQGSQLTVVGSEALVRWRSPTRGLVSPNDFISTVESSDLIKPFTWQMLKMAVSACSNWSQDISVSVNIPPKVITDDEIVSVVDDTLAIFGLDGSRLVLEVTERGFFDDPQKSFEILDRIREQGVKVSIDDFGTGQSSLSHFREIPADELKIDCSFVFGMCENLRGPDKAIVKSIIDLAHNFSLNVVAEGVETEAVANELWSLGCDMLQGYWISEPVPDEEFSVWLTGDSDPRH